MIKQLSETFKSFQHITVFVILPLFIAVYTDKINITVALDIIVWYIAISFGVYIFKTPLDIYFLVKDKTKQLREQKQYYDKESYHQRDLDLYRLEWRMFIFSVLSPFIALFSWYGLEKFCVRYSLNTLSNLIHPYFIIVAGFISSYQPIISFMNNFKDRLDSIYPRLHIDVNASKLGESDGVNEIGLGASTSGGNSSASSSSPPPNLFASSDSFGSTGNLSTTNNEAIIKNFVYNHTKTTEDQLRMELAQFRLEFSNYIKNLNTDNNQLKRDIRDWTSKKSNELSKIDSRVLSCENQLEIILLLLEKEKASNSKSDIFKVLAPFSQKFLSLKNQ